jgi:TonB family protein
MADTIGLLTLVPLPSPVEEGAKWDLRDISFIDSSHGIIAAAGGIFVTDNGGATWNLAKVPVHIYESIRWSFGLIWVTEHESDQMVTSQDGGVTWKSLALPSPFGAWRVSVVFGDASHGFLANGGVLYETSDGGTRWHRIKVDGLRFYSLYETGSTLVAFTEFNGQGQALTSNNGGTEWHSPLSGQTFYPRRPGSKPAASCPDCITEAALLECAKHKEWPTYPTMAQIGRVKGVVTVKVDIDSDGKVRRATLVSGHPMLATSALEAAKRWTFDIGKCGDPDHLVGLLRFRFPNN